MSGAGQRNACVNAGPAISLNEKVGYADVQSPREGLDHIDGRITRRKLKVTDIGSMNARLVSKCLLAKRTRLAQTTKVGGKAVLDIHPSAKAPMSTNDLQTMSDIGHRLH